MGSFVFVAVALVVGIALSLQKMRMSARSLRRRCVIELQELTSELRRRHTIILHLIDSLPGSWDHRGNRMSLSETRDQAEQSLAAIDPLCPTAQAIHAFCGHEQDLGELIDDLLAQIQKDPQVSSRQTVSGCISGLDDSTKRIRNGVSTYNSAAINLNNYVESPLPSLIAKTLAPGQYALIDLDSQSSGNSARHAEA